MRVLAWICAAPIALLVLIVLHLGAVRSERLSLARQFEMPPPYARVDVILVQPLRDLDYQCGWARRGHDELTFVRRKDSVSPPRLYRADERVQVPANTEADEYWPARLDDMALTACRRKLAPKRFASLMSEALRAPEGDVARLVMGGRYFEVPAGNVQGKVAASKTYRQAEAIPVRGFTPAWTERHWQAPRDLGFGRDLSGTVSVPPAGATLAFKRLVSYAGTRTETLASKVSPNGEVVRRVKLSERDGADADVYLDLARGRMTTCYQQADPRRNPYCKSLVQDGDFLIQLTFAGDYAGRRNEIIDTLLKKLRAWERV